MTSNELHCIAYCNYFLSSIIYLLGQLYILVGQRGSLHSPTEYGRRNHFDPEINEEKFELYIQAFSPNRGGVDLPNPIENVQELKKYVD